MPSQLYQHISQHNQLKLTPTVKTVSPSLTPTMTTMVTPTHCICTHCNRCRYQQQRPDNYFLLISQRNREDINNNMQANILLIVVLVLYLKL
jgi:hypothetical protein